MTYLTLKQITSQYKEIYITWPGLGDNLAMFAAVRNYFEKTGKKLLISTNLPELLENTDYCDYTDNINKNFEKNKTLLESFGVKITFLSCTHLKWLSHNQNIVLWPKQHITAEYCSRLGLSGQVNLLPFIKLTPKEKAFGRFFKTHQIAIMTDGLQKYKTYPFEKIQKIVNKLYKTYNFVQIGKASDQKLKHCLDKRGALTLRATAAVLSNSDCFVGGIGGLCHLAASVGCPSVITYSAGEPQHLASYPQNINIYSKSGCSLCGHNLRDPQHQICPNNYSCIRSIETKEVISAIHKMISRPIPQIIQSFTANIQPAKESGLIHYYAQFQTLPCESAFNRPCHTSLIYLFGIPLIKYTTEKDGWKILLRNIPLLSYKKE